MLGEVKMKTYEINRKEHVLERLIDMALEDAINWITSRCKPQEPDYVAALSTEFTKTFFHILAATFPEYDFSVSSVYCHQKPIVDINWGKKPELGDILFLYVDRTQKGEKIMNSLLLQAKISEDWVLKIHQNEKHQLELYKRWPEFTYYRAGDLNGKKRNISPKTINDGAQYLLINSNTIYGITMGCSVPDDTLYINNSLSKELINLLKFKSGRTVDSDPNLTTDDWSKMIWDLLHVASSKYTKRKNAHLTFSRYNECTYFCTENMSNVTLLDEEFRKDENKAGMGGECKAGIGDEDSGVSVVLIESRRKEERAIIP